MRMVVSIVDFRTPARVLGLTLASLEAASARAIDTGALSSVFLDLVDNSNDPGRAEWLRDLFQNSCGRSMQLGRVLSGHGNVGYGAGHNLSIRDSKSVFHLVANPDLDLDPDALMNAVRYLASHPSVGLLSPQVKDENGQIERRRYRYPSVLCLGLRGFAPSWLKSLFKARLDNYTFASVDPHKPMTGIPIVTGCFMMFRTGVVQALGGFDERFFLYFEDFDLALRAGRVSEIHYCPDVVAVHFGGKASRKGLRHIMMFVASAARFFNKHGWKLV